MSLCVVRSHALIRELYSMSCENDTNTMNKKQFSLPYLIQMKNFLAYVDYFCVVIKLSCWENEFPFILHDSRWWNAYHEHDSIYRLCTWGWVQIKYGWIFKTASRRCGYVNTVAASGLRTLKNQFEWIKCFVFRSGRS